MLKAKKRKPRHKGRRGFTIIEVVLVLAIAGLIFLAIFLAIPALQLQQRDRQRQQDVSILEGLLEDHRVNSGGTNINTQAQMDTLTTVGFTNKDPKTGVQYEVRVFSNHTDHPTVPKPPLGTIYYVSAHKCGSDTETGYGSVDTLITSYPDDPDDLNLKRFALLVSFENGALFCVDSYY